MKKPKPTTTSSGKTFAPALVISTEEAFVGVLNDFCTLQLVLAEATAAHETEIAARNAGFEEVMQADRERLAALESTLHLYATNNRAKLLGDHVAKSRTFTNAVVGFRNDPPAVKPIIKGEKDETIALRLSGLEWGGDFMDWKPQLNKKLLLARRLELCAAQIAEAGITFVAEEKFFITPLATSGERVTKTEGEAAA